MMAQVAEYASGKAVDPFLQMALKPAESLSGEERAFLLRHSFYSDPQHMIHRYPRYGELFDAWQAQKNSGSRSLFGVQDFRDLQMWSQLAWFDEEFQEHDPEVRDWMRRGRDFTLADQRRMGEKQREIVGQVLPEYRKLAAAGQIEISTTPYYHPILPLLCDSNIAAVSHPGVPLPPRFRYPQDARRQLAMAREYDRAIFRRGAGGAMALGRLGFGRSSSPSPPSWDSNGPPPTAACSTARWGARWAWTACTAPISGGREAGGWG